MNRRQFVQGTTALGAAVTVPASLILTEEPVAIFHPEDVVWWEIKGNTVEPWFHDGARWYKGKEAEDKYMQLRAKKAAELLTMGA